MKFLLTPWEKFKWTILLFPTVKDLQIFALEFVITDKFWESKKQPTEKRNLLMHSKLGWNLATIYY